MNNHITFTVTCKECKKQHKGKHRSCKKFMKKHQHGGFLVGWEFSLWSYENLFAFWDAEDRLEQEGETQ